MVCVELYLAYFKDYVIFIRPAYCNHTIIILFILESSISFSVSHNVVTMIVVKLYHYFLTKSK